MFNDEFNMHVDSSMLFMLSYALLLLLLLFQIVRSSKLIRALSSDVSRLKYDLNALCRGTANVDRRLDYFDDQVKRVMERQEKFETPDVVNREYDHAIRAIKNGASFERLVNIHGLSRAEAKLLLSLHGESCNV